MFDKVRLWWKYEGRYYHKDFIQGIKNLWKWFPTIWKDRDWDHSFIYTILAKKIENQAKCIGSNDRHMSAARDVEIMLLCVRLIKIQQEDLYGMEYMDYINKEYEFVPTDETKKWYTIEDTVIEDNLDEYFKKYPKAYKKITSGEEKDRQLIAMEIAEHNQQKSHKLLFKILEEHLESWWD
jgi:hypothetical protein